MKVKILRRSSLSNNFLETLSSSASSSSTLSMVAPRGLVVETGGRLLDKDEEKNAESPTGKKVKAEKLPISRWEFAAALGVFLVFSTGLLCIYLTMPAAEYGMLKLPRNLADLRLLKDHLAKYAQVYPAKFILGYCSMYIFMQTFMIPGTIFMSLLAGALFGVKGIFLVVFNATAGASCCFFLSKLIGKPIVNWLWPERLRFFQAEIAKRREKLLNYMLFLRVTPTLPNLFINLASPIVDVPFHIFFLATVIGLIPASYITVKKAELESDMFIPARLFMFPLLLFQAGLALGDLKSVKDLYDVKTLAFLFLIGSLLLVPTLLKRKRIYE